MARSYTRTIRVILLAAVMVFTVSIPALAEGKQEPGVSINEEVSLSLRVEAPEEYENIALQVGLLPMKTGELDVTALSKFRFLYVFNLDIYGGTPEEPIVAVGGEHDGIIFSPEINVYISSSHLKTAEDIAGALYFLMPEGFTPFAELSGKDPDDGIVSELRPDRRRKGFYFQIYRWPIDDRVIVFGE